MVTKEEKEKIEVEYILSQYFEKLLSEYDQLVFLKYSIGYHEK